MHLFRLSSLVALMGAMLVALAPSMAQAHPLGNFSVNRFTHIEAHADHLVLRYVIDMAEIPTFQAMSSLDANGDGTVNALEGQTFLERVRAETLAGLQLKAADHPLHLTPLTDETGAGWAFLPGQGGLQTLRLHFGFRASLTGVAPFELTFEDTNEVDRLGWREIIVTAAPGAAIEGATVPAISRSNALHEYPTDLLNSPLQQTQARFRLLVANSPAEDVSQTQPTTLYSTDRAPDPFATLLTGENQSLPVMLGALFLAMMMGAGHALTPGHGKAIVAAYLVGTRGTAKHALFLGLVVTITHTAGVFILGLLTLFASRHLLAEQLFPWVSLVSGLLVVLIGANLFLSRLRGAPDHHHHTNPSAPTAIQRNPHNASSQPPTFLAWRGLLALGISGGILPCPSALVVLLGAIALGRVGFGLLLILAFSAGLAGVLTTIGLLLVYANRMFAHLPLDGRLTRLLPAMSAALITIAGVGISLEALRTLF